MLKYRGYEVSRNKLGGWSIMLPGKGGSLADSLKGSFTTDKFAARAIDSHLNKKPVKKNGDSEGTN